LSTRYAPPSAPGWHPVGASGAIIATKAIHELQRIQDSYALATIYISGQGIAVIFERV